MMGRWRFIISEFAFCLLVAIVVVEANDDQEAHTPPNYWQNHRDDVNKMALNLQMVDVFIVF